MFHELLNNPNQREPGPLQADARVLFPSVVKKSHLVERVPGPLPSSGKFLILGVATYSPAELRLLDEVEAAHARWKNTTTVYVFDMTQCQSMSDVRGYVPPFFAVVQTPVVVWGDGGKEIAAETGLRMTQDVLTRAGIL